MFKLIFIFVAVYSTSVLCFEVDTYDLLMPDVYPHRDELYLCTSDRIPSEESYYLVGFQPNATMHTAHHMLLFGCTEPGANDPVWNCGTMQGNGIDSEYLTASPCLLGSHIIYAWARDAPALKLPRDVGFLIGKQSHIKYLVLQVHYMSKFPAGKTDNSGVFLHYTLTPMPRQAGVILLSTYGFIAPKQIVHMETACTIEEDKVIHPFAFRTHTHALGKVVSGYRVRRKETGDEWQLIGKKDPQLPQMFYPVSNEEPIRKGDVLAARCTMDNTNDYVVQIGTTNKDEMCNFYLMYWVENTTLLEQTNCYTYGPPSYSWATSSLNFNWIPDREASSLE